MKITRISCYQVDLPLHEGSYKWSGGKSVEVFDSTIVAVETDTGHIGYGECCPLGPFYLPAYAAGVRAGIKELGPHLIGEDEEEGRGAGGAPGLSAAGQALEEPARGGCSRGSLEKVASGQRRHGTVNPGLLPNRRGALAGLRTRTRALAGLRTGTGAEEFSLAALRYLSMVM